MTDNSRTSANPKNAKRSPETANNSTQPHSGRQNSETPLNSRYKKVEQSDLASLVTEVRWLLEFMAWAESLQQNISDLRMMRMRFGENFTAHSREAMICDLSHFATELELEAAEWAKVLDNTRNSPQTDATSPNKGECE